MVKLARVFRLQNMIKGTALFLFLKLNSGLIKTAVVFLATLVGLHLVSCLFLAIPTIEDNDPASWIYRYSFQNLPDLELYIQAFYYCLTTLTTVGYGDITPRTKCRVW